MCIWMCMIANHKHGLIRQTALSVLLPLDLWVALCIAHSAHFHWEKFCPPHKITRYYPVHWLCPAAGHQALLPGHCGMAWWWLLGQSSLECHFTICGFDVVTANCSWSPNGEQREISFGSGLSGGRGKLPGRWGNGFLGWPEKWREETGLGKPYKGRKQWLGKSRCLHTMLEIGLQSFPHSFHHLSQNLNSNFCSCWDDPTLLISWDPMGITGDSSELHKEMSSLQYHWDTR